MSIKKGTENTDTLFSEKDSSVAINYTASWRIWRMVCELQDLDPYKTKEFSIDLGGGRTRDFEYTGDIPKKDEST